MEIVKKGNYLYNIEFKKSDLKSEILLKALFQSRLLGAGTTLTSDFKKINFNAQEVETLTHLLTRYKKERKIEKLNYDETEELIFSLKKQLEYLKRLDYTFFNFTFNDIIVITKNNNKIFINTNTEYLLKIENNLIKFISPFNQREKFLDPEIKELTSLPSTASCKAIYYSLGHLALYSLFEEEDKLEQIKFTKVYWEILRCIKKDY